MWTTQCSYSNYLNYLEWWLCIFKRSRCPNSVHTEKDRHLSWTVTEQWLILYPPMLFSALCLDCEDTGWEEKGECSFFLGWSQRPVELWRAREILLISIYGQVVKKFCFYCPLERGRIQQMFYTLSCFWIHAIPFLWFLSAQFLPIWTEAIEIFHWCVSMVGLPMSPPLL